MIAEFIDYLAARWSAYLAGIAALSVLSMALLQTAKDLFPIRRLFQRAFLRSWLARKCGPGGNVEAVETDLIALATDGEENAFYDLPIEQLCGQMAAAAQVVIENPSAHAQLLRCLASRTPADEIQRLTQMTQSFRVSVEMMQQVDSPDARRAVEELSAARARATHQIQRNIDAFQIAAAYRWKLWFQIASFVVSFVIAYLATGTSPWPWATRVFVAVAAGFFAPVARDLQARIQQVK